MAKLGKLCLYFTGEYQCTLEQKDDMHLEIRDEDDHLPYVMPVSKTHWGLLIDNVEFEEDEEDEEYEETTTIADIQNSRRCEFLLSNPSEQRLNWTKDGMLLSFKESLE